MRGTIFDVNVAGTGDVFISVETGVVTASEFEIPAGSSAEVTLGEMPSVRTEANPVFAFEHFRRERETAFRANRKKVAEAVGHLLKRSIERRRKATREIVETIKDIFRDNSREDHLGRMAHAIAKMRSGLERARDILSNDRESQLQEEVLREILAEGNLGPFAVFAANATLLAAEKDRGTRNGDLAKLDDATEKLGGALATLAAEAAARPEQAGTAAKILRSGLGLPIDAEPSTQTVVIDRTALGWERGRSWTLMRTIRGKEDARMAVAVSIADSGERLCFSKTPEAFDTAQSMDITISDSCVMINRFAMVPHVTPENPALFYRFPFREGDSWTAWNHFLGSIERAVTATEHIETVAGAYDCLRVETRFRPRLFGRKRAPLIHVEWIAPGIGQVREVSFRNEITSVIYEERL